MNWLVLCNIVIDHEIIVFMFKVFIFFFFKQKTAYEMRISDWSSDVCSSDLPGDGLYQRRSDHLQALGGNGLRGGDAAGGADRFRPWHSEQVQPADDHRERQSSDHRRRRRRYRQRRGDRDGAWLRRRAD